MGYDFQYLNYYSGVKIMRLSQIINLSTPKGFPILPPKIIWEYWSEIKNIQKVCLGRKFIYRKYYV